MRRFGRILLNALTVVSVLLCLATIVLWARYRVADWMAHGRNGYAEDLRANL